MLTPQLRDKQNISARLYALFGGVSKRVHAWVCAVAAVVEGGRARSNTSDVLLFYLKVVVALICTLKRLPDQKYKLARVRFLLKTGGVHNIRIGTFGALA